MNAVTGTQTAATSGESNQSTANQISAEAKISLEKSVAEANVAATSDELKSKVSNLHGEGVTIEVATFNFRKDENGYKRPSLQIPLPIPNTLGLINILDGAEANPKLLELLTEAVQGVVISRARDIIGDDASITALTFPYDQVSWDAIANLPRETRRGAGIAKETWEAFGTYYGQVMPEITGKAPDKIANSVKLMLNRFQAVKNAKPILQVLKDQLALFANQAPDAENYSDVIEFLNKKLDEFLALDEKALLESLI